MSKRIFYFGSAQRHKQKHHSWLINVELKLKLQLQAKCLYCLSLYNTNNQALYNRFVFYLGIQACLKQFAIISSSGIQIRIRY